MTSATVLLAGCVWTVIAQSRVTEGIHSTTGPPTAPSLRSTATHGASGVKQSSTTRPSPFLWPRPVQQTCRKHKTKYVKRLVCPDDAGFCRRVSCPVLPCEDLAFFKTEAQIRKLALANGANFAGRHSGSRPFEPTTTSGQGTGRRRKLNSLLGCNTQLFYSYGTTIYDQVNNDVFTLAEIPSGCGSGLYQPVLHVWCPSPECCNRQGQCNGVIRDQKYFVLEDGNVVLKNIARVTSCECVSLGSG